MYRTGDLARYRNDGTIEFLGRMDQQVKVRGHRIELVEIETVLGQHSAVGESAVVVRADEPGDQRIVAYVVLHPGLPRDPKVLRSFLLAKLPEYMVPGTFVFLDRLPKTPNGKIDRRALPAPDGAPQSDSTRFVPPRTPTEKALADILAELLGVPQIGIDDNFFELGGHSLMAAQLITRLRNVFQMDLPLRIIFDTPTVAGLAAHLTAVPEQRTEARTLQTDAPRQESAITVKKMQESDLDTVIDIHIDRFPDWRSTLLGRPFLKKMYRWFMVNHGELALVSVENGKVIGFTIGSVGGCKRQLFFSALPQLLWGTLINPLPVLKHSTQRVLEAAGGRPAKQPRSQAVVRPDVADNNAMALSRSIERGGLELMLAFEAAAQKQGVRAHFHEQSSSRTRKAP